MDKGYLFRNIQRYYDFASYCVEVPLDVSLTLANNLDLTVANNLDSDVGTTYYLKILKNVESCQIPDGRFFIDKNQFYRFKNLCSQECRSSLRKWNEKLGNLMPERH